MLTEKPLEKIHCGFYWILIFCCFFFHLFEQTKLTSQNMRCPKPYGRVHKLNWKPIYAQMEYITIDRKLLHRHLNSICHVVLFSLFKRRTRRKLCADKSWMEWQISIRLSFAFFSWFTRTFHSHSSRLLYLYTVCSTYLIVVLIVII